MRCFDVSCVDGALLRLLTRDAFGVLGTPTQVNGLTIHHDRLIAAPAVDEKVGDGPEVVVQCMVDVVMDVGNVHEMFLGGMARCCGVGLTHAGVRVALVDKR